MKSTTEHLIDDKAKKKETIKHEVMRSLEEVQIANFLYLNHVEYEYEKAYPFNLHGSNKVYTPDFTIHNQGEKTYLEHFGISESGENNRYSKEELDTYKKHINDKIKLHNMRNTKLIYTFSSYNDGLPTVVHLKKQLEELGIELKERSVDEVYQAIINDESNKYFLKLIYLIKDFISSFKINGFSEKDFNDLKQKTDNVRNKLFLKICKPIYLHYQAFLLENNMIDFEDMINESSSILKNEETKNNIPDFDYAIIDEYQDISQQRFDLSKALSDLTNAKIIAVGDDWQSIFAFAGSRIDLFLKFKNLMGYADYLTIDYTYRNAQEVIDIAGAFIQKNDSQLKKHLKSPKSIQIPISLYEYSDITYKNEKKGYKGIMHEKAKICDSIIGEIIDKQGSNKTIALLGRYNFELTHLENTDFFRSDGKGRIWSIKYPKAKLLFYTIHGSKGLGFDNVIILNGSDEVFGFPSQIEMDPLLKLVKYDDNSYSYAEERRLFYVALTRTKNQVYILYPKTKPSEFVLELAKDYDLVNHPSSIHKKVPLQDRKDKLCPNCGYPLQLKNNKTYGLKLFMCTNEPEICGYMTNNLRSGKKSISKCPDCLTGFLIVKHSKKNEDYFFGCTNYKKDGNGCNHMEKIELME
ncbi:MAG: UvrD-helicase domain-containing protein [Candidatus Izemoplasmatales bacterium]